PGGDAQIQWDPPADGVYRAVVGDLDRAGGPEYVYRLSVRKPLPGVEATVDAEEYRVAPGKPATIKVKVNRSNGHIGGLVVVKTDAIWLTVVPQASDAPAAPKPK